MQKKKILKVSAAIFCICLLILPVNVHAADENNSAEHEEIIGEQVDAGGVEGISGNIRNYANQDAGEVIPDFDPESILKEVTSGKYSFSVSGFINRIMHYVFKEIYLNISIMIKLIILAILCAVLKNLQASFLNESVGEVAFYTCYIVIASIMIVSFSTVIGMATDIIDKMVGFMQATIPVLITLLLSGGNITSAAVFQPILIGMVGITATIIKTVFIPLIFLSTVLSIVNNISDKIQLSKLAGLLKQVSGWILGFILTVFVAIISVQGSLGAVVDGVTSKTAKFAIGAFIPVAGKYLADAADTVVGCTLLIKNSAGVLAMIGIVAICLVPMIKIFALIVVYRLSCVLIEPISEKRITDCISDMAGSLTFVLGVVAAITLMFLITLTVIISASNISSMIR